jgi:hypothetical protein
VSIAEDRKTIVLACKPTNKHFTFDHAAGEDSTQEELFEEVGKPVTQVTNPTTLCSQTAAIAICIRHRRRSAFKSP